MVYSKTIHKIKDYLGVKAHTRTERRTALQWFRKYFLDGQHLHETSTQSPGGAINEKGEDNDSFSIEKFALKHRKILGLVVPVMCVQFLYWSAFVSSGRWFVWTEKWQMSVTMIFGALFAGMTSEGGGAVAFPVMTLVLGIHPSIARDFAIMVQACGMTTASLTIISQGIAVEINAIVFCSIGGVAGVITGLYTIDNHFTPSLKKIVFVSVWFSFAFALFLLNLYHKRKTYNQIPYMNFKKIIVLLVAGFIGGMFTSFAGNGLDICCFSVLTLIFRVSEKIATPTSVILMAINSIVTFYWRGLVMQKIDPVTYDYLAVTVPIVTVMAPVGATLASHFHRHVLASFVYGLDTAALIGALSIVHMTGTLWAVTSCIIVFGFSLFVLLTHVGSRLLAKYERQEQNTTTKIGEIA